MTASQLEQKRSHLKKGQRAETLAALYLRLKGYRVLARQLKTPHGEIDILARKGKTLIAVEVKFRPSLEIGLQSISGTQQQRIARALNSIATKNKTYLQLDQRRDAIVVRNFKSRPIHVKNAW